MGDGRRMQVVDAQCRYWICCLSEEEKSSGPRGQLPNPGTPTVAPSYTAASIPSCRLRWTTTKSEGQPPTTNHQLSTRKPQTADQDDSSPAVSSSRSPAASPPPPGRSYLLRPTHGAAKFARKAPEPVIIIPAPKNPVVSVRS